MGMHGAKGGGGVKHRRGDDNGSAMAHGRKHSHHHAEAVVHGHGHNNLVHVRQSQRPSCGGHC